MSIALAGYGYAINTPFFQLPYKTYGADQGISGTITALTTDNTGFMWVGTENGLYRYQKNHLIKQDLTGSPSMWVQAMRKAQDGGLWLNADRHIVHFKQGQAHPLQVGGTTLKGFMNIDQEGRLWVIGGGECWREQSNGQFALLWQYDKNQLRIRKHTLSIGPVSGKARCIINNTPHVWDGKQFAPLPIKCPDTLLGMEEDGEGYLWFVSAQRLLRCKTEYSPLEDYSHWLHAPCSDDGTLFRDDQGRVWIPTVDGFLAVKGETEAKYTSQEGLPKAWGRQACTDKEGNVWLGGAVLHRILGGGRVKQCNSPAMVNNLCWGFFRDSRQRLWSATNNGVFWLQNNEWKLFPGTQGLPILYMGEDKQGYLWAGPRIAHPLLKLDPHKRTTTKVHLQFSPHSKTPSAPSAVNAMLMDPEGMLWLALPGKPLLKVDPPTQRIVETLQGPPLGSDLTVHALYMDPSQHLWIAAREGLFCKTHHGYLKLTHDLKHTSVLGIKGGHNKHSVLLYYAEPLGITEVALEQEKLVIKKHVGPSEGLLSGQVVDVAAGSEQTLWIATDKGLHQYDGQHLHYLTHDNGLPSNDCCQNSLYLERDGTAWIATVSGIACCKIPLKAPLAAPPAAVITHLTQGKQLRYPPFPDNFRIPHREATVECHFDTTTFADESRLEFQVRLEGLEPAWRTVDTFSSRYAALSAGRYHFEVRARRVGEAWGPPTGFSFRIMAPWWWHWSVILLELGLFFVGVSYYVRWRLHKVTRAKAKLEALVVTHTRELHVTNHALQEANRALENMSLVDPLTEGYNRRYLFLVIKEEYAKVQRFYRNSLSLKPIQNQDLVIFLIDLDNFHHINEQWGHSVGDAIIRRTAHTLKGVARETDVVVRMEGESFVLLARSASRREAPVIAERIRSIIGEQVMPQEATDITWTCSIGFAAIPFHPAHLDWMPWEKVIDVADACLELAKNGGRNAWVGAHAKPALEPTLHEHLIPWQLEKLVEEGVLEVVSNLTHPFREKK